MIIDTEALRATVDAYYDECAKVVDENDKLTDKQAIAKLNKIEKWQIEKRKVIDAAEHLAGSGFFN